MEVDQAHETEMPADYGGEKGAMMTKETSNEDHDNIKHVIENLI